MTATPVPINTTVAVEQVMVFTVATLCRATGADAGLLRALVDEGVLQPMTGPDSGPTHDAIDTWQFTGQALPRTRTALRLARDFELNVAGVALVMDLLADIAQLRTCLRQHGVELPGAAEA